MNKYLKYYYLDTLLIIITSLMIYCFDLDQMDFFGNIGSGVFFPITAILMAISLISLLLNIVFKISKYNFDEDNILFPKYYLIFFILIVILGVVYNQFIFIKCIHVMYYFGFLILGYAMLSVYTSLSFKKEKNIKKRTKKNK